MNTNIPIVLAAFGTTSRAMDTYSGIDTAVKGAFPGHPVRWAYTSRMVRSHMKKKHRANMKNPLQVLDELAAQGHAWAVVQSMHFICGHEFYRLVDEVKESSVRTSMGLPLLTSPGDYQTLATAILGNGIAGTGTASVLVGHGTDHPAWTAYPALQRILQVSGANVHVATVEGESAMQDTVTEVVRSGADRVHLVPLMLVAGVHLQEDIAGDEDSWKRAFMDAGLNVTVEENGLGKHPAVVDIFLKHIRDALAIIPERLVENSV
jgi:sirohydrochlorin cobaltochelatase